MDPTNALPKPWDKLSQEPARWYARFERYRLAGPSRSLLAAVNAERQELGKKRTKSVPQAWAVNAKRWRWRERADAWDDCQRQEARAAYGQQLEEMRRRHVQEARALQSTAVQRLKTLDVRELSPAHVLRFFVESAKLERLALGDTSTDERSDIGSGAASLTVKEAVRADQELEEWHRERLQPE